MKLCVFNDLTRNEKYNVHLKIATRKYEVVEQGVIVHVDLEEDRDVFISNEDSYEFRDIGLSGWEPIYGIIEKELRRKSPEFFLEVLKEYKNSGGVLGSQIKDRLFIKYYRSEEPEVVERNTVGRKWINYNSQLIKDKCSYEPGNGCGIWVTNADYIYKTIGATWRYGENIMVLSPVTNFRYIVAKKEIVGDAFEVKMYGSLEDKKTWNALWELLGDGVAKYIPQDIIDKYEGAKEIYDMFWNNRRIAYENERNISDRKRSVSEIIKRILCGR